MKQVVSTRFSGVALMVNALLKHADFNTISGGSNCSESALFWSGFGVSVAFLRRAHFGHVSGILVIVPVMRAISTCFSNGGERPGQGVSFGRFFQKVAVGRPDVWTVGRMTKMWHWCCTCAPHVANVSGFKATR